MSHLFAAAIVAKKQKGKECPVSWVHKHGRKEGEKIRCTILVNRALEDRTVREAECGAEYHYNKKKPATSGFLKHLMEVHNGEVRQQTLKQEPTGRVSTSTGATASER